MKKPAPTAENVNEWLWGLGNQLLVASALSSLVVYCSHDASGLQYIMLDWNLWFAAISACLLAAVTLRVRTCLAWLNLTLPFVALLLATLPQVTGLGYDGSALGLPGISLAIVTLALTAVVVVLQVRRLWRQSAGRVVPDAKQ